MDQQTLQQRCYTFADKNIKLLKKICRKVLEQDNEPGFQDTNKHIELEEEYRELTALHQESLNDKGSLKDQLKTLNDRFQNMQNQMVEAARKLNKLQAEHSSVVANKAALKSQRANERQAEEQQQIQELEQRMKVVKDRTTTKDHEIENLVRELAQLRGGNEGETKHTKSEIEDTKLKIQQYESLISNVSSQMTQKRITQDKNKSKVQVIGEIKGLIQQHKAARTSIMN